MKKASSDIFEKDWLTLMAVLPSKIYGAQNCNEKVIPP